MRQAFEPAVVHSGKWEDANCYPAVYPSSLSPSLSSSPAFALHSWSWQFLYFDFLQALPHRIAFSQRHGGKPLTHTDLHADKHTHTHTTNWLPDLPLGPEQPSQSSTRRPAMTMQNGWTHEKGMKLSKPVIADWSRSRLGQKSIFAEMPPQD